MDDDILEVKGLRKTFHSKNGTTVEAVKGISFSVKRGEVFGFLGPNGAGKSTTISMLTTQLKADSGEILLDGSSVIGDPVSARAKMGVVAQYNNLDRALTARENLLFHARYFGMDRDTAKERADGYLESFGLWDRRNDYVSTYSGGMAQRLKIARAMMHHPAILFLDEPTTGLDPNYREILWKNMMELNSEGTTIFLTTHYMEEPERFCQHIAIVSSGELKAYGTSDELKRMIPSKHIVTLKLDRMDAALAEDARSIPHVTDSKLQNGAIQLYLDSDKPDFDAIVRWADGTGRALENLSLAESTLDDVFVYLTGKGMNSNER